MKESTLEKLINSSETDLVLRRLELLKLKIQEITMLIGELRGILFTLETNFCKKLEKNIEKAINEY